MKPFHAVVLFALFTILATPVFAQRDVNTSSARAAYDVPSVYTERKAKKIKQKPEKESRKARKARSVKSKKADLARVRRSSLHF